MTRSKPESAVLVTRKFTAPREASMPKFEEIVPTAGFLVDAQMREALKEGYLIEDGTYDVSQIRHASRFQLIIEARAGQLGHRERTRYTIAAVFGSKRRFQLRVAADDAALVRRRFHHPCKVIERKTQPCVV
jgi:hypothetical protein